MVQRSMLYVPGFRPDMVAKAAASAADSVCIDLEDAVGVGDKAEARRRTIQSLRELDFGGRIRMVRVNGIDTPFCYRDIIEVAEEAGDRLDRFMLPKAHTVEDVAFIDRLLTQIEMARGYSHRIQIEVQIESAAGFLNAQQIAAASPRIAAIIFGPGDYAASMRMPSAAIGEPDEYDALYGSHRWHAVMHTIVAAGRAAGIACIDGPFADFRNDEGFERSCRTARAMGFDGKQCIHPRQIAIVNKVFSPTPEEVAQAERVLAACEGKGAATLDGRMVDVANLRMSRWIVEQAREIARSGR
jgi:citrate lyase subunit beta/citryl-CoA lyase